MGWDSRSRMNLAVVDIERHLIMIAELTVAHHTTSVGQPYGQAEPMTASDVASIGDT